MIGDEGDGRLLKGSGVRVEIRFNTRSGVHASTHEVLNSPEPQVFKVIFTFIVNSAWTT